MPGNTLRRAPYSRSRGPCEKRHLSRIVVRSRNSVVLDTSVTATVLAAVASPRLTLLGMAAVLLSTWDVEIEKPQDLL